jgi:hypothetical protein
MQIDEDKVQEIVEEIGVRFRTFGGGLVKESNNPISNATERRPLEFAACVNVEEVVRLVLSLV